MKSIVIGHRGFIGSKLATKLSSPIVLDSKSGTDAIKFLKKQPPVDVVFHLGAHLQPIDDTDILLHRAVAAVHTSQSMC